MGRIIKCSDGGKIYHQVFEVSLFNDDISIDAYKQFQYSTMANYQGMQCNFNEGSEEYNEMLKLCENIHQNFIKLNSLLQK